MVFKFILYLTHHVYRPWDSMTINLERDLTPVVQPPFIMTQFHLTTTLETMPTQGWVYLMGRHLASSDSNQ